MSIKGHIEYVHYGYRSFFIKNDSRHACSRSC